MEYGEVSIDPYQCQWELNSVDRNENNALIEGKDQCHLVENKFDRRESLVAHFLERMHEISSEIEPKQSSIGRCVDSPSHSVLLVHWEW